MEKKEFYILLDKWTETPEFKRYEEIAEEANKIQEQLNEKEREMIATFAMAIGNDIGKQISAEPEFIKMFSMGK